MGKHSPVVEIPQYMEKFSCIGPACEETCCTRWTVTIDKATWKKYKTISIQSLAQIMERHLEVIGNSRNDQHARFRMTSSGDCPFLDPERLCRIQGQLGESFLSDTCNFYPRMFQKRSDGVHMYATLSCPEAARRAILEPNAMDAAQKCLDNIPNESMLPILHEWRQRPASATLDGKDAELIHRLAVSLVKLPGVSCGTGLSLVLLMVRRISQTLSRDPGNEGKVRREDVFGVLEDFTRPPVLEDMVRQIGALQASKTFQVSLLEKIIESIDALSLSPTLRGVFNEVKTSLRIGDADLQGVEAIFLDAETGWFLPLDAQKPYLLKNYVLNDLERNAFGFYTYSADELEKRFLALVIRYALVRFLLVGLAAGRREAFGEQEVPVVVQAFARNVEHNGKLMPQLLEILAEKGIAGLATAMLLLK